MSKPARFDTRSALLREAEKLIRTRGYAGFSYADLSASVGISKASIHHHFRTKELLAISTLDAYRARYAAAFLQIEADHSDALNRIDAYGRLYLNGLDQSMGCLCAALAVERETLPESLHSATTAFFRAHLLWLVSVYRGGLAKKQVSDRLDPEAAAQLVLSVLEGALIIERVLDTKEGFETALHSLVNTLAVNL